MTTRSEDELFETLTLNREVKTSTGAHYGGYSGAHLNSRYGWNWGPSAVREEWTNSEGIKHRIFGPAVTVKKHRLVEWYKEGELHRIGGPARVHGDNKYWYVEGKLHNLEGPAVIDAAGPKQYWIDGVKYSVKQYKWEIARRKRKGLIK